jgi:plastocyanin
MALAGSFGVGALALTSGAAVAGKPKPEKSIVCKTLTGNAATSVVASNCSGNTGGASTTMSVATLTGGGTVTWVNTDTTTISAPTLKVAKPNKKCSTGAISFKSTVTADTTGLVKLGTATGAVCVAADGTITATKPMKLT